MMMGLFSKDIQSMDDLFVHGLQDIYYAENQILKSLPNMIEKAASGELRKALQTHLAETRKQVQQLERVFRMHGNEPQGSSSAARSRRSKPSRTAKKPKRAAGRS